MNRPLREIESEIREIKREMKRLGIRRVSCFNGGLTGLSSVHLDELDERRFNERLFRLKAEKMKARGEA